jgi:hypothetical protein
MEDKWAREDKWASGTGCNGDEWDEWAKGRGVMEMSGLVCEVQ